jgi:hypothetical protein
MCCILTRLVFISFADATWSAVRSFSVECGIEVVELLAHASGVSLDTCLPCVVCVRGVHIGWVRQVSVDGERIISGGVGRGRGGGR